MTDNKGNTKHKILGELESIKTLLDDRRASEEPPLLTTPADESEVPLLTEAVNGADDTEVQQAHPEAIEPDHDDIPLLKSTVEDSEWWATEHDASADDDLVARALKSRVQADSTPPLFSDANSLGGRAGGDAGNPNNSDPEDKQSSLDEMAASKRPTAAKSTEEQPGLFDRDQLNSAPDAVPPENDATGEIAAKLTAPSQAAKADTTATVMGAPPPSNKTENPFLPKHIRDRLQANRAAQQEMLKSFLKPSHLPKPGDSNKAGEAVGPDEQLVNEMLQLYLPQIEAELREKIRAMIREERKASQKPQEL